MGPGIDGAVAAVLDHDPSRLLLTNSVSMGGDHSDVKKAGGDAHVGVGQGHDPVLPHVTGVFEVTAGGHGGVHIGDGAAVHGVPAGADDRVHVAPVQAGVGQGQPGRLIVVLVVETVVGGSSQRRLTDPDDSNFSAQPSPPGQ